MTQETQDDLVRTVTHVQPSDTEPALRVQRRSADATGNLVEYVDEDGELLNAVDNEGNSNGGSVPGAVRFLVLPPFTYADIIDGPVLLYTPTEGELVLAGAVVERVVGDWGNPAVGELYAPGYLAGLNNGNDVFFGPYYLTNPVVAVTEPIYGGYGGSSGANGVMGPWLPNHAYPASAVIFANGNTWGNVTGAAGDSDGSEPDWGSAPSQTDTVTDGADIIWTNLSPFDPTVPTSGSLTAGILIASA